MWSKSVTGGKYIFKEYVLFYGVAWYKVGKSTQPGPFSNQRKGGVNLICYLYTDMDNWCVRVCMYLCICLYAYTHLTIYPNILYKYV